LYFIIAYLTRHKQAIMLNRSL